MLHSMNVIGGRNSEKKHESVSTISLGENDSKLTVNVGDQLRYSHSVHGSVGYDYKVEYDKSAFKLTHNTEYDNPESVAMGMCGGDSAVKTCILQALKKGKYKVKVIHEFRGAVERVITYTITVK